MPTALISLAGGANIFAGLKQSWTSMSREQVVRADPQCIIINNYGNPTAQQKEQFLETSPITRNLTAVKNRCFLPVPNGKTGVCTVWRDQQLLYAGMAGRAITPPRTPANSFPAGQPDSGAAWPRTHPGAGPEISSASTSSTAWSCPASAAGRSKTPPVASSPWTG
jgi:hypothetical protein